jgi:preprotein translocase subunit SecF
MFVLKQTEIPFMKYRWWFFSVSIIAMVASVVLLITGSLNYGTDFKGGLKLIYQFNASKTEAEITDTLGQAELPSFVVQRFGDLEKNTFIVKSDVSEDTKGEYAQSFTKVLQEKYGQENVGLLQEEYVGPKAGKELRTKGIKAVFWSIIIMLVYIGFRFDFYFAPGAIFALIHDVLLTLAAFILTQREVNLTVLAAFLTIVGYSVNDTIILFDRIRENIKKYKGVPLTSIIDRSMTQVLVRTIITSVTVFFVVVVLFLRAEGDIQNFAFAMIVGVVVGSYSSIFVASPVFLFLREHGHWVGLKKPAQIVVSR